MNRFLAFLIILISSLAFTPIVNAQEEGASLTIYPQTGAYTEGSTFEVSVFLNTGGNYVDAVEIDLKFNPDVLQVVSPVKEFSIVSTWTSPPAFSNTQGIVFLRGRFKDKGINISEGLVSDIVFRAKSKGEATVKFLDSSKVISAGEKAENILNSVNIATFSIYPIPQRGPQIFSNTHPDQNKWYKNNNPTFIFKKTTKTEGFSFSFDNTPYGEPDNIINTTLDSQSFEEFQSGTWYLHLKAKESGAWGGASHFKVNIDNDPPASFKPHPETFGATADSYLLLYFNTYDLLSGIDYYEARIEDRSNPKNILYSGFVQIESPYKFKIEKRGVFKVVIQAYDKAGNYSEGEVIIRVLNKYFAVLSFGPLLFGLFFPWWLIILFLIIILLISAGVIFWIIKRRNAK